MHYFLSGAAGTGANAYPASAQGVGRPTVPMLRKHTAREAPTSPGNAGSSEDSLEAESVSGAAF